MSFPLITEADSSKRWVRVVLETTDDLNDLHRACNGLRGFRGFSRDGDGTYALFVSESDAADALGEVEARTGHRASMHPGTRPSRAKAPE